MTPTSLPPCQGCSYDELVVQRVGVQGLEDAMKEMERRAFDGEKVKGRRPRLGNEASCLGPRRFYVELTSCDLKYIIIPSALKPLLLRKLSLRKSKSQLQPKISMPIRWSRCCEYFVQVEWFNEDLVAFRAWREFVKEKDLGVGDLVVFAYDDGGFDIEVYKCNSCVQQVFECAFHRR